MSRKKSSSRAWKYVAGVLALLIVVVLTQVRLDIPLETLSEEYADEYSAFADINGIQVHYRDEGKGDPLILIHGWAASLHTWDGWVEELKDDFRIIRLDLPGFGLTGPADGINYTFNFYVDFMDSFLTELDIEECYFAGNSLGGAITWNFAHRHPDRVRKIILLDAAGYPMEGPSVLRMADSSVVQSFVRYVTPEYGVRFFVSQVFGDTDNLDDDTVRRYHRLLLREGNRESLFKVMEDGLRSRDGSEDPELIGEIDIPALIMWGDQDDWTPLKNAYRFDEDLPDSRLIVYEGAGHIPMEEIPEKTASDARSFLLKANDNL